MEVVSRTVVDPEDYELAVDENGAHSFDLSFKSGINKAYQIEYTSKNSHHLTDEIDVTNKVESDGKTFETEETMKQQIVIKGTPKVDYRNMKVDWQVGHQWHWSRTASGLLSRGYL